MSENINLASRYTPLVKYSGFLTVAKETDDIFLTITS